MEREFVSLLDLTFYIDVPDELGLKRRMEREKTTENQKWFEEVTFPEYKKHREPFEKTASIVLSGEDSLDSICKIAVARVREMVSGESRTN